MLVGRGALSFRTYQVSGHNPTPAPERVLERLEAFAFTSLVPGDEGSLAGWVGGEHLFDGEFNHPKMYRGRYVAFAMRLDTRKVDGGLLKANFALEMEAVKEAEGLERLSGHRKRELKLMIRRRLLKETPPKQKAVGVFWNVHARRVYFQNLSKSVNEEFRTLFERTFEVDLVQAMPGLVAMEIAERKGLMEEFKDVRPLRLGAVRGDVDDAFEDVTPRRAVARLESDESGSDEGDEEDETADRPISVAI